jgi:SNF2 family DNA or RNA helicase
MNPIIAELDETGSRIVLHDTLWADKPLVTQIPGKEWNANLKQWTLPKSWAACIQARAIFGDRLKVGKLLGGWSRLEKMRRDAVLELRDARKPVNTYAYDADNDHADKLYPFQLPGRDFMVTAKCALLGDEMGSGKTLQTLAALRAVNKQDSRDVWGTGDESGMGYVEQGAYPALVVCPNSTKRNWAREITKWLPEATPVVIDGSAAKRRKQLEAVYVDGRPAIRNAVVIMNIESIRLHSRLAPYGSVRLKKCRECDPVSGDEALTPAKCETHDKELNAIPFKVCVLDEAHRVKDPRALQSRAIWRVFHGPTVEYRWALTGTPVANHPGDIWSILHTIDPEGFPRKSAFIDRYAEVEFNAFGGMSIVGLKPATRDEFLSLLDVRMRRMLKALVLDQLPAKTRVVRHVEMSPKQAKAYKEVADEYVLTTESGDKLVMNGNLPAATRLLQLASAMCDVDKGETPEDVGSWKVTLTDPSSKIDELMSIIEDNPGKPLAIAAEHRQLIDLATQRLTAAGIEYGVITGGVTGAQRDETVEAFQSGKLKYILFTYKAGGVGLNMTAADTLVRLQRSWSLIDNMQGEDRVHRIGSEQHEAITIIDIITADTIEETQVEKLYAKMQRLEEIVRDREQLKAAGKSTAHLDAEAARIEALDLLDIDIDAEITKYEDAMNDDIDGGP